MGARSLRLPAGARLLSRAAGDRRRAFATFAAGVRYQGRTDVMLGASGPGSTVAGVFTRSATRVGPGAGLPGKDRRDGDEAPPFLVNSGNSNAFTGAHGVESVAP